MLQTAPAPGILKVSATAGGGVCRPDALAPGDGQLWHAQASQGASLAQGASTFHPAFCADEFQLVESGGTMVWRTHFQTSPPRILQQRGGPAKSDWRVSGCLEWKSKTLCLDGHSPIDSAEARSLPTNLGADPTRLYSTAQKKTQETTVQLILGHYTRESDEQ